MQQKRSRSEDENEAASRKGEGEKEEVRCEVLICWKQSCLSDCMRVGAREVAEDGVL